MLVGVAMAGCGASSSGSEGGATGNDAGGDGAGSGAAGGADGAVAAPSCADYCAKIQAACTMGNEQYGNLETCTNACPAFPVGRRDDTAGDTLGCRVHYAERVAASAALADMHCGHAGPGGDGVCGENCGGYCDMAMTFCTDANAAKIYDSRDACLADCATHGTDAKFTSGSPGTTDMGNEVGCILYHAEQASLAPAEHCPGDLAMSAQTCR